jgi:hypothetical protein
MLKQGKLARLILTSPLNISKTELVPISQNVKKTIKDVFLDLSLNFIIKRIILGA